MNENTRIPEAEITAPASQQVKPRHYDLALAEQSVHRARGRHLSIDDILKRNGFSPTNDRSSAPIDPDATEPQQVIRMRQWGFVRKVRIGKNVYLFLDRSEEPGRPPKGVMAKLRERIKTVKDRFKLWQNLK